jgi:hypothetical protein
VQLCPYGRRCRYHDLYLIVFAQPLLHESVFHGVFRTNQTYLG